MPNFLKPTLFYREGNVCWCWCAIKLQDVAVRIQTFWKSSPCCPVEKTRTVHRTDTSDSIFTLVGNELMDGEQAWRRDADPNADRSGIWPIISLINNITYTGGFFSSFCLAGRVHLPVLLRLAYSVGKLPVRNKGKRIYLVLKYSFVSVCQLLWQGSKFQLRKHVGSE